MSTEKAPAYQWYVKDWRSSRKVQRMSWKERGMYREMLDEQWERGTLPGDPASVAMLLGGTSGEWTRSWPALVNNFKVHADGRIQNTRLEEVRDEMNRFLSGASSGGSKRASSANRRPNGTFEPAGLVRLDTSSDQLGSSRPPPAEPARVQATSSTSSSSSTATATALGAGGLVDPEIASRAGLLVERYGDLFAEHRRGARHRVRPNLDWNDACDLCRLWDDARLTKLATIVLTTDDPWIANTDRSFKIFALKATWADERLAAWAHEHGVAV